MLARLETPIARFLRMEAAGGILLMFTAILAIVVANTPLHTYYDLLLDTPVSVQVGALIIAKPLLLWINDGLMAIFFFLVGLELKREIVAGELSELRNVILPGIAAVGGMVVPAAVYLFFNLHDPVAVKGWAIPAATDIAFALGVLMLLGSRVPVTLKVFLTSVAIFDDIGAIAIIALFYTSNISLLALLVAVFGVIVLTILNRSGVTARSTYMMVGLVIWVALLKSGVHATLAGVIVALFIPYTDPKNPEKSPLRSLEHDLHSVVAFFVLPVFAFANAGVRLSDVSLEVFLHDVPIGVALGLIIGKQIGVFGFALVAIKLGLSALPKGMNWLSLYGVSALCGIGFTMSLFIGSLAFEESGVNLLFDERLGILLGSVVSGLIGYLVLRKALNAEPVHAT